jgi:STE24 endopeptidase
MFKEKPTEWIAHDRKLRPYLWSHRILGVTGTITSLLVTAVLIFTPTGRQLEAAALTYFHSSLGQWIYFFGTLALVMKLISLPLSMASHEIEWKFGLAKQKWGSWFGDQLKTLLLGAVLGGFVLVILRLSLDWFPTYWWVFCGTFLILFSILLAQLAPVLLIPLFFKMKPMEPSPLKDRLLELCRRFKIEVKEVYHLGLGEKTEKGNAAFMGLGRTKRIVIGDTLYEKFTPDEVEAVFAHELGHQVHNDLWKGIALSAISIFVGFGVAQWLTRAYVLPRWGAEITSPFGFLLFFVTLSIVQMPLGVVQAVYSRTREWAADEFADVKTSLAKPLGEALERLTYQNFGRFFPNPVMAFLTHSHPAPGRRILRLRAPK